MIISITFPSIITATLSHKTHHDKVTTNSHVKVQTMNSLETQQPMFSVTKQFAIQLIQQSLSKSSTYSTIIWSSMIAYTQLVHMSKMFQPDTWKDRGLLFCLPTYSPQG